MIIKVKGNQIFVYGTIWEGDGTYFLDVFSRIDGTFPVIDIHLHCNGGSVFDGNLMYNSILTAKSPCDIYIDGVAASMAAILTLAARKVYMVENGFLMIHAPSGYTWGDAKKHESNADLLRSIEKNFTKKLIAKTGMTEKQAKELLVGDNWFNAEQAKEAKLIDDIIEPVTTTTEVENPTDNLTTTFNSFAALLAGNDNNNNNDNKNPLEMKKDVIAKFGLVGVNEQSSDTAVIQAIEDHFNNKTATLQSNLQAEKTKYETLEKTLNEQRDTQIKNMLDAGQAAGKFTAAQRETYESIGKASGIQALETVLEGLGKRTPLSSQVKGGGSGSDTTAAREGWDWDKYQKEAPQELEALAQKNPESFGELYQAKFNKPFKNQ
ncbi:hypothetical protein FUA48_16115 [Flavobacterium alkalisoli]|uniref:ATP-dependent Clp protease proteolytic subunit n=1 Tax=Flavobacterium alkalisoli TaxID=2602769 RepID=A0A5B9FYD6_9FLAO|nr:head maturation protease, ClpP-related [Flavobacterium alkalisoli]QEE51046.1 hypothetical protein FUA48_16115 [Flavobacterium alkalisoli]